MISSASLTLRATPSGWVLDRLGITEPTSGGGKTGLKAPGGAEIFTYFADQYEEGKQGFGKLTEITASHPWLSKRMKALDAFAESEIYRKHAGLGAGGLSMEQVDEKVHEIIKVVG